MREQATLARPYASALFRLAREGEAVAEWASMLQLLAQVVADPAMKALIADPRLPSDKLKDLVLSIVGDRLTGPAQNLVRVLVDNRRLALAPQIAQLFEEEQARAQRREKVLVRSAYPIDSEHEQAIAKAMRARLGCEVEVQTEVDRSLIGGVVIRTGDRVLDASVRGRLQQLAAALA